MKRIIFYIAASIDGKIAEPDGSLDWLTYFPNPEKSDFGYSELLASVDTIIMGGRTYREIMNMDVLLPYEQHHIYVISHHKLGEAENLSYITENIIESIKSLRDEQGKDIWLVGGGEVAAMLLEADLVDEIRISYIPVILGKGKPLFPCQSLRSNWKLKNNTKHSNGILSVTYAKA